MTKRIEEFDLWRPGYGSAVVNIYLPGTTTLASVYTDEPCTVAAPNPQTLAAMESAGGVRYGKFNAPLYTTGAYYLSINGIQDTGIIRPDISSLDGEDASAATVVPAGSSYAVTLAALAGQQVNVANFGVFVAGSGGVAATNTTTLNLAIAALSSGGIVNIPAGSYKVNAVSIPPGVVIKGQGVGATSLVSVLGATSFTIAGASAGFQSITLDGTSLSTGSVGVRSIGNNGIVFNNVLIERFAMGLYVSGGSQFDWKDFTILNTNTAAQLWGETTPLQDLVWNGGMVSTSTTLGLDVGYKDHQCQNITFIGVYFQNNVGEGLLVNGAQNVQCISCSGDGNTAILQIQDDATVLTPATISNNQSIGFQWIGGRLNGGSITITGTAQDVRFKDVNLNMITFNINTPITNYVILDNCFEQGTTITGSTTMLVHAASGQNGKTFGLTTSNSATKAWGITLKPGQVVLLTAKIVAKCRNVAARANFFITAGAYQVGAALAYKVRTATFNPGSIVTGASSGATARIQADAAGTTGTLTLTDIVGVFLNNEIITDNGGTPGSATVNGTITTSASVVDSVGNIAVKTAYHSDTNWVAAFVANTTDIELQVTGDTAYTVEWTCQVDVVST